MAGLVKPGLDDSKSRLAPYDDLSEGTKKRMKADREKEADDLESQATGHAVVDSVYNAVSAPGRALAKAMGSKRDTEPQDRSTPLREKAKGLRNWKPDPNTLYGDDEQTHDVKKGEAIMKKGMPKP